MVCVVGSIAGGVISCCRVGCSGLVSFNFCLPMANVPRVVVDVV